MFSIPDLFSGLAEIFWLGKTRRDLAYAAELDSQELAGLALNRHGDGITASEA